VPGIEGDFGVLAGHAPMVATLKPGVMTVFAPGGTQRFVVFGGFAEISPSGMTVLAEVSVPLAECDRGEIATRIRELEDAHSKLPKEGTGDRCGLKMEHYRALERMLPHGAVTSEGVDTSRH